MLGQTKKQNTGFPKTISGLFNKLTKYKDDLLQIDPLITDEFRNSIIVFTRSFDSVEINQNDLFYSFFDGTSAISSHSIPAPVVVQSSTIVQSDEPIEITAGVASFENYFKPKVFIYGKLLPLGSNGVTHYVIKAASKPGKYYVPVKINYMDQDGRQVTVQKEIEYTVANIEKQ